MNTKNLRWKLLLAGVLVTAVLGGVTMKFARATPGSGVMTTILTGPVLFDDIDAKSETDDHEVELQIKGFSDVYIVHNVIPPGGHTGWHSHPGISFVTVRSGEASEYSEDNPDTPRVYPAGTGLVEEAGRLHRFANEGDVNLELVAFQILPFGAKRRIDQPAP